MKDKSTNIFSEDYLSPAAYDFIEASKATAYDVLQNIHITDVLLSSYIQNHIRTGTVELGTSQAIPLVSGSSFASERVEGLNELLKKRTSTRNFTAASLSLQQVSNVLLGGTRVFGDSLPDPMIPKKRSIASAGGLYPIEVYFIARNVSGCEKAIYFYNQQTVSLQKLRDEMGFAFLSVFFLYYTFIYSA